MELREKYKVDELFLIKTGYFKSVLDGFSLSKYKNKKIIAVKDGVSYIDVLTGKRYLVFKNCNHTYLENHIFDMFIYDVKPLPKIKKCSFIEAITLEEIINLYFELNKIKDTKIQTRIKSNVATLAYEKNNQEVKDIVLRKILEIKNSLSDLSTDFKNSILEELLSIMENYVDEFILSKSKNTKPFKIDVFKTHSLKIFNLAQQNLTKLLCRNCADNIKSIYRIRSYIRLFFMSF